MKGLFRMKSVLWRYIFSFSLSLILPLSLVSSFFVISTTRSVSREVEAEQQRQLQQITLEFSREIENLARSALQLSSNPSTQHYKMKDIGKFGSDIINALKGYRLSSSLISNIYLFAIDCDYAYSCLSSLARSAFYEEIEADGAGEEYLRSLSNIEKLNSIRYGEEALYCYFSYPVTEPRGDNVTYLIYEISYANLREWLRGVVGNSGQQAALLGDGGRILSLTDPGLGDPDALLSAIEAGELKDGPFAGYTALQTALPQSSLQCLLFSPEDATLSMIRSRQLQMFQFILLTLVLGGILDFVLIYDAYRPVRKLDASASLLAAANDVKLEGGNEFERMQLLMENMESTMENAPNLSGIGKDALRHFLILRLIQGRVQDYALFRENLSKIGVRLDSDYYFAVVLHITPTGGTGALSDQIDECLHWLDDYEDDALSLCAAGGAENKQIVLLCGADTDEMQALLPVLQELLDAFCGSLHAGAVMGVGQAYPELNDFATSYFQAAAAYEYRVLHSHSRIFPFSPAVFQSSVDIKYRNALGFLSKAIQDGDPGGVEESFAYISRFVGQEGISIQNARLLCHNLVEMTASSFYGFKYQLQTDFSRLYTLPRVLGIGSLEDLAAFLQDVKEQILLVLSQYGASQQNEGDNEKKALTDEMQAYLDENITNHQFSIGRMAAEFGFSTSYISRVYKEHNGITIMEYLNRQRMEKAKSLLSSTEDTLESIVNAVGYFDVSSFIRKFKKEVGMTPGEYRHQQDAQE